MGRGWLSFWEEVSPTVRSGLRKGHAERRGNGSETAPPKVIAMTTQSECRRRVKRPTPLVQGLVPLRRMPPGPYGSDKRRTTPGPLQLFKELITISYMARKVIKDAITPLGEAEKKAPKLFGVPTGVEGLDELFFITKWENGKGKVIPLNGIPSLAVVNITGVSDTGKSLMAEQFAIKQAALGYPVAFVTVESPAAFVAQGMKGRAAAMGYDWKEIEDNIIMIDAASYSELREDIPTLLNTLASAIKEYHIKSTVIDSVTGFFESKEMLARSIVRELFNFMKKWYQTAIFISQKRSGHDIATAEAAGGYAVSHIVDASIVLSKKLIETKWDMKLYGLPIGEVIRTIRIDGCRLSGHDTSTHLLFIEPSGIVKVGPTLSEYIKQVRGGEKK